MKFNHYNLQCLNIIDYNIPMHLFGPIHNAYLNMSDRISSSPESIKFYTTLSQYQEKSGDVFTKMVIIKSFEKYIDEKYIKATGNDIKAMNNLKEITTLNSYDLSAEYKAFIGKMINDLYTKLDKDKSFDEKMNSISTEETEKFVFDNFEDILCEISIAEYIKLIKKEELIMSLFEYIDEVDEKNDNIEALNNGGELFNILVDVFNDMVLKSYDNAIPEEYSSEKSIKWICNYHATMNKIYDYEPKYYDDDYEYSSDDGENDDTNGSKSDGSGNDKSDNDDKIGDNDKSDGSGDEHVQNNLKRKDTDVFDNTINKKRRTD
jgi:hypothetical protein